jgi:hypothetical protein
VDDHALFALGVAGGDKVFAALNLYNADTAGAGFVFDALTFQFVMAERGDCYTDAFGSLQNGGTLGDLQKMTIDC